MQLALAFARERPRQRETGSDRPLETRHQLYRGVAHKDRLRRLPERAAPEVAHLICELDVGSHLTGSATYSTPANWPAGTTRGNRSIICCCTFRSTADICGESTRWLVIMGP